MYWMEYFSRSVLRAHDVAIGKHRDIQMLTELIDTSEICLTSESLLIGPPMDRDEIGACALEAFAKVDEMCSPWLPTEASFDADGYFHSFGHFLYYAKCGISMDHQRGSVTWFDDFFGWTAHVDVDSSSAVAFDNFGCLCKHSRIFAKYLENNRLFAGMVGEDFAGKISGSYESVCAIKLCKNDGLRSDRFHYLSIGSVAVSIHGSESNNGALSGEIWPIGFWHRCAFCPKIALRQGQYFFCAFKIC